MTSSHSGTDPAPDAELGVRLARGDRRVMGDIYDLLGPIVWSMARRAFGPDSAEDVVQEVFLQVWTRRQQFDPARGRLTPWLLRVARNRITDRIRAAHARPMADPLDAGVESRLGDDGQTSAWEHAWIADQRRALRASIDALSAPERDVLWLAYFGYSQSEISDHLSVPLGTVKTRTRSGLRKLRDRLIAQGMLEG